MTGEIMERTVAATCAEIERSPWRGRPAKTIFFGGGTPTFLEAGQLNRILAAVLAAHPPIADCEITSEANPGTVDASKFAAMRDAGFNRLSLGAQSFQSEDLVRLGRVHGARDVGHAVALAREAGFENVNIDLIFGLPGQSVRAWEQNLDLALALGTEHLSLYGLTIEPNTRFYKLNLRGMLNLPDDEAQARMFALAQSRAQAHGFRAYEISNYAKPGFECRHNLAYWRAEEYLAYGPGAVGCYGLPDGSRQRYTNTKHPQAYCEKIEARSALWCDSEQLSADTLRLERIMLGLRTSEGFDAELAEPSGLSTTRERGWTIEKDGRVLLTEDGRLFCSAATAMLI